MRPRARLQLTLALGLLASSPTGCVLSSFEIESASSGGSAGSAGAAGAAIGGVGSAGSGGIGGGVSHISQPALVGDSYVMLQGTVLERDAGGGLLANDSPVNLSVSDFSNLDPKRPRSFDAELSVEADGSFRFAPPPRFFGSYYFTYTAQNLIGQSASSTVEVQVVPTEIDLDAIIQGIGGYILYGASGGALGAALDGAHDVNGDGRADVIIGAPGVNAGDGAAFVVFGKDDLDSVDVEPPLTGSKERRFMALLGQPGDGAGSSVAGLGDVDDDGGADLAVGASSGNGRAYFVFARDMQAPALTLPLGGYRIEGDGASIGPGALLRGGGDVNGDGVPDALLSSLNGDSGWLHLPYGGNQLTGAVNVTSLPAGHVRGAVAGDGFPLDAAFAGDVNGDGADEVLAASAGAFYLFRGGVELPVDASTLSPNGAGGGYELVRAVPGQASVAGLGDINGDGIDDFGYCDGLTSCSVVLGPVSTLANAAQFSGFRRGTKRLLVRAGGDIDGDGFADVVFADDRRVYVVYGSLLGAPPRDVRLLGSAGFSVLAAAGGSISAVAGVGDVNHDGLADLAIADQAADTGAGRVYVVLGNRARER
ncbi:MAG: FG-GAP-like repeat-containing protein [Polyangiaceae bacterium]